MTHFMLPYSKLFYWSSSAFISSETTRHPWKLLAFLYPLVDIGHFLELSLYLLLPIFHYLHKRHRVSHSSQQVISGENISWNNGSPALLHNFAGVPWMRKITNAADVLLSILAKDHKCIGQEVGLPCFMFELCGDWMFLANVL